MSHPSMGQWYGSVLQDSQYGCRKERDCVQALVPLGVAHTQNQYVASLDLKQAFDRVRPSVAVFMLRHYGFDRRLAEQVRRVWTSQQRFLHFAGNYKQTAVEVSQSLPQGCPLSPWALNTVLCAPAKLIQSNHPQCVHVTHVDDRSFAARSLGAIQSIWNQWREHTAALALEESVEKTQITCRCKAKRNRARENASLGQFVQDFITILGTNFSPGNTKPTDKEVKHFETATEVISRAAMAPVVADMRLFTATTMASAKAATGWVLRAPTLSLTNRLEAKLRSIGWNHKSAAVDLVQLIQGHSTDIKFVSRVNCVSGLYRYHKLHELVSDGWALKGGFARRCRNFLQKLGWEETGVWNWKCSVGHLSLDPTNRSDFPLDADLLGHLLRESWRHARWRSFLATNRNETPSLLRFNFMTDRIKVVQQTLRDLRNEGLHAHGMAVATGAFVSPMRAVVMGMNLSTACPYCGHAQATKDHLWWSCGIANGEGHQPTDNLEKELGWPVTRDMSQLRRLAIIRSEVLACRYNG